MAPYILGLPLSVIRKILQGNAVFIRKTFGFSVKLRDETEWQELPGGQAENCGKGDGEVLTQRVVAQEGGLLSGTGPVALVFIQGWKGFF